MNTTTGLTLNDRFSLMKKPSQTRLDRGRSRSRSRSRQRQADLQGSRRNRILLNQLERQHKLRAALKLKKKSIMRNRPAMQGRIAPNKLKRAAVLRKAQNVNKLRRNSLTTFVPLNDAPGRNMRGRSRSRSRQTGSIQDRLGIRQPQRRMRMRRQSNGNGLQNQRSRSRVRLNRNNFRNNNNGNINNQAPLRRSNSVNARLGQNGPQNQVQNRRRRFRSRSRNANANMQVNRPLAGRIAKRKLVRKGNNGQQSMRKANAMGNVPRNIRNARNMGIVRKSGKARNINSAQNFKRSPNKNGQARGRAKTRGQGQQRRGRSRTRRGNNRGGALSKEQLDKQLDEYMSKASN